MKTKPKLRKCRNRACRKQFMPVNSLQVACHYSCALVLAKADTAKREAAAAKKQREKRREAKERLKTRSDHMREAQQDFNAFIRERDRAAGHRCISSNKELDWSGNAVDAGHYRSIGSAPHLRFDERNCHAQSKQDNRYLSGNAVDYRIGLIKRIGLAAVLELEADQTPRRYTINDLIEIKKIYRAKTRALKKERGHG